MRITFIKENRDAGTESISTCDTAAFITRIKSETKPGHVSALRTMLEYTSHGSGGTDGYQGIHVGRTVPQRFEADPVVSFPKPMRLSQEAADGA